MKSQPPRVPVPARVPESVEPPRVPESVQPPRVPVPPRVPESAKPPCACACACVPDPFGSTVKRITATARATATATVGGAPRRRSARHRWSMALLCALAACAPPPPASPTPDEGANTQASVPPPRTLDDFENAASWQPAPASGVEMRLSPDDGSEGQALRVDFDFQGGGGWAALRRELDVQLPENYELSFWLKADAPSNTLELKLIDDTGENVWWINRREFEFAGGWRRVSFRKRHVTFAWGPRGGGEIRDVAAIEFAITAGTGGQGTVWFDRMTLTPLEPIRPYDLTPVVTASAALPGEAPPRALDADTASAWRTPAAGVQTLTVDFLRAREFGGLIVGWDPQHRPADYDVRTSRDGRTWQTTREVRAAGGERDYLFLPETEARYLRLSLLRTAAAAAGVVDSTATYALRDVAIQPIEWGESRNTLFETIAADARRGLYPKYLRKQQSYWTVVGVDGGEHEALINEEGMVEVDERAFSIEPFLAESGRLLTWADGSHTQSLERGVLPIPSVRRDAGPFALTVTAWAAGDTTDATLRVRYVVTNTSDVSRTATLYLALRPFQVNPSWQFLNNPGGVAPIGSIVWEDGGATVSRSVPDTAEGAVAAERWERDDTRRIVPSTPPAAFGAATFDQGGIVRWLAAGALPADSAVDDPFGAASAALAYPLELPAGASREVYVSMLWPPASANAAAQSDDAVTRAAAGFDEAAVRASLDRTIAEWAEKLGRFSIELPAGAPDLEALLKSTVAYVLINRDGPAIQPGSRSYERSWIRDGSLTSAALLALGHADEVRDFIRWYAPFQYADGKVPCCVDESGAGPVPENDSHGQLIFVIAEYHRYTGDRALLEETWPHVERAVAYMDSLRQSRRTAEYRTPEMLPFFGLMPESISHEGYSAKPMHSYWDDFFALKGLKDATYIAEQLGRDDARARFAAIRDEFEADLMASFRRTLVMHGIDYLPGAVELGDFDATSTTVGLTPAGAAADLPQAALARTFEKYWENAVGRMDGSVAWEAYTPYELRTVGTFVRLGAPTRAHALLEWFLEHQRPAGWNHWAEVVFNDVDAPRFIGDMPHTWVGSDFIRSVVDMFVYHRDEDDALVLGAGILPDWLRAPDARIAVSGLRTPYGTVDYTIRRTDGDIIVELGGDVRVPPGGFVLRSPLGRPIAQVVIDGRAQDVGAEEVRLSGKPRQLTLRY
jgi:F5/8 type C domain/Bacterial alpha-L-rhamnosidase 6 hairpin glycosidase domain